MCISLSVFPGFNGSEGIFHASPMARGVFPYVPSQKETEWKIGGGVGLLMYVLQDGFWRGKLSSV